MAASTVEATKDPNSVANIGDVRVNNYHIVGEVDMEHHRVRGHVVIKLATIGSGADVDRILLDIRDVNITKVEINGESQLFEITSPVPALGQCLSICLSKPVARGPSTFEVTVGFETSPSASGLQWLPPAQTEGKEHPYLFSQFQAIHCRSFIPCQDTPAVKATYSAEITVPKGLTALMSAIQDSDNTTDRTPTTTTFFFTQKVPIPSYLIAIVVGKLTSRDVGPRTRVWSEPCVVDAAAFEFANTEDYLRTAEELLTPYEWGRYDLLVLPGSFPYGGMENPCLTFVTPTLLAGDRSLTGVVAHEIAHSWMGNLVTNRSWEHFWLNEGFTVFIERKILGRLHGGEKFRHFEAIGGWGDLKGSVDLFGAEHPYTALNVQLEGQDPDDAFSSVPYEKGFAFLFFLETLVGIERFEAFLKQWVIDHAFGTVTCEEFRRFFEQHFDDVKQLWQDKVDWQHWFTAPGMPSVNLLSVYDDELVRNCQQLADKWAQQPDGDFSAQDLKDFSSAQTVLFLELLYEHKPSAQTLTKLDATYDFTKSKNCEIRFRWFKQAIASQYPAAYPALIEFLTVQGRMKYVRPLYRDLFNSGEEEKQLALKTFAEHRSFYNNIAAKMLAKDLKLE